MYVPWLRYHAFKFGSSHLFQFPDFLRQTGIPSSPGSSASKSSTSLSSAAKSRLATLECGWEKTYAVDRHPSLKLGEGCRSRKDAGAGADIGLVVKSCSVGCR